MILSHMRNVFGKALQDVQPRYSCVLLFYYLRMVLYALRVLSRATHAQIKQVNPLNVRMNMSI